MALQDPVFFLGLAFITFIGFALRAMAKYDPSRNFSGEGKPMKTSFVQVIFLVILVILWMILIIK